MILRILNDPVSRQGLEKYVLESQLDPISFNLYFKIEDFVGDFYYKIDMNGTIASQLRYRTIIEYPEIVVVSNDESPKNEISIEEDTRLKEKVKKEIGEVFKTLPRQFGHHEDDRRSDHGGSSHRGSGRGRGDRGGFRGSRGQSNRGSTRGNRGTSSK